jgi:signal transduction histidine kinase
MRLLRSLLLDRIGGQIALLIIVSLIAIHGVITASFHFSRNDRPFGPPGEGPADLIVAMKLIAAAPAADRAAAIAQAARALPQLQLSRAESAPTGGAPDRHTGFLSRALGDTFKVTALAGGNGSSGIAVTLPDGTVVTARLAPPNEPPFFAGPVAMTAMFVLVSITLLGLWAALALRNPLSAFARAAENFSLDDDDGELAERGPEEIRAVARAFNRMRARIRTLVDDRTRLFAAMGHDLRTPITRLRLRSEFIADAELREQMLRDLDQMKAMTESVLTFLRDGRSREAPSAVDIASGLQTIADEFADIGHAVSYEGPDRLIWVARPNQLHRATVNLVDNAVRYGSSVVIRLSAHASGLHIDVEDDGPGIPADRKASMLEPFTRGDTARTMDERSGFGLGLAIARAVAEAHGGTLSLNDRVPHGLTARLSLPAPAVVPDPH